MILGLNFLLCINGKTSDIKKNFIQICIFSCSKCILMTLFVKVFVSQGYMEAEIIVQTL